MPDVQGRRRAGREQRRSHGAEPALLSARACHLAGFGGTATTEAGRTFGIAIYGTMAHSHVQVHAGEPEAFERFALAQPDDAILDAAGFASVTIFASGSLDEHRLRDLVGQGAPIDGFGVGTRMNTSADAPCLDCAYKLQECGGPPRRKRSEGKATWPVRKQPWRRLGPDGSFAQDTLRLADEPGDGIPMLAPVMRAGREVAALPTLAASRAHAQAQVAALRALADEVGRRT